MNSTISIDKVFCENAINTTRFATLMFLKAKMLNGVIVTEFVIC